MAMAVSNQQSRDAALVRATTELFVLEQTHDADEIRRFEELATHFLPRVSAADRAFVAERLSKSVDAPSSILRLLGKDLAEIASPILKRSPALDEFDLLTIMAATGPAHHRLIATRSNLPPLVVAALRLSGDADIKGRIAQYPPVMTESEALAAEDETPIAAEIAAPVAESAPEVEADIEPEAVAEGEAETDDEPAPMSAEAREIFAAVRSLAATFESAQRLQAAAVPPAPVAEDAAADAEPAGAVAFLGLDRAQRLERLRALAGEGAALRPAATIIDADHAFRLALGRARLASHARQRQRDALIRTLAQGLRLSEDDVTALMDDPSGEALVVLLRAIGLAEAEAQQVLLFANPVIAAGVDSFARLAQLLADTRETAAHALVADWRAEERPAATPQHAPLFADLALRRGIAPGEAVRQEGTTAAPRVQDPIERSTFGLRGR